MKCLNVIILYDNRQEVETYLQDIAEVSGGTVDVALVVNRNTNRETVRIPQSLRDRTRILDYGENVGYLNALLKTIRDMDPDRYDYYILSNTDIRYEQKDFFRQLSDRRYPAEVGCIAPSVYSTKIRNYQNPHYRERIPREKFEKLVRIFRYPLLGRLYLSIASLKGKLRSREKQESCFVYSPNGAYMIFTKAFIRLIQGYEYGTVLYSEESCIGELLLRNRMKCFYDSTIEVIHRESTVTGRINYRKRFKAWRESMEYILKEFY